MAFLLGELSIHFDQRTKIMQAPGREGPQTQKEFTGWLEYRRIRSRTERPFQLTGSEAIGRRSMSVWSKTPNFAGLAAIGGNLHFDASLSF
jgi:hypothetical protein